MAIIADDEPAKEKISPADITVTVNEPPANDGFCTDKTTEVFHQPCNVKEDPETEPLPPPEITPEPETPGLMPLDQKKARKKKRQRKKKSKKIKAVMLVKGPRTRPGILSGKFHVKLPKKAVRNGLFLIALCTVLRYQLAQSAIICTQSVPVPDSPLTLSHNNHMVTFQNPKFCPETVHISDSCAACFEETSLLKIICSNAADIEIWGEPRKGNGDVTFVKITSEAAGCNYFVNKSQKLRKKRSVELGPGADLKGNKKDVSVEERKENLTPDTSEDEICTITIPVTDFPIVIRKNHHHFFPLHEATFCPERVEVMKRYSACFENLSLLEISYKKNGNYDFGSLWVEHGKGRGTSSHVEMKTAVCKKIVANVNQIQRYQSDGDTNTENREVNKGRSLQPIGILMIPIFFIASIFIFV